MARLLRAPVIAALAAALLLAGCGKSLDVGQTTFGTYGLLNSSSKSPDVCYEVSAGNVVWSLILIETFVFPIYFVGFSIFNPVRVKTGPTDTCGAA